MAEEIELAADHNNKPEEEEEDEEDDDEGMDTENENDVVAAAVLVAAAEAADDLAAGGGSPEAIAAAVAAAAAASDGGLLPHKRRRTGGKKGARPWNDMLFEVLKYRFLHGNVMVPFKSGGDLGKWVAVQRAQYMSLQKSIQARQENNEEESKKWASAASEGGSERLTEERMKVLSSIGFVWDVVQADNASTVFLFRRVRHGLLSYG